MVGGAPPGALDVDFPEGVDLPGDWFVATDVDDVVVGVGWLDVTWGGDAEVLLAVDPAHQGSGVGSFVLDHLEQEAAGRGVNYVYNTVRDGHPHREAVHDWLLVRGYTGNESDASLRKRVGRVESVETGTAGRHTGRGRDTPPGGAARPPGHEESGGYVDVEDHRY